MSGTGSGARVPGGVLGRDGIGIDKRLVLDNQRDLGGKRRNRSGADERSLLRVPHQVGSRLAGIDVEPGDAVRVVVVEHEASALLVGVVEGQIARPAAGVSREHVRNVTHADAFGIGLARAVRSGPLMHRAVADPRRDSAVQVKGRTVTGVAASVGTHACAHERAVDRQEEISTRGLGQEVRELHTDRLAALGDDRGPQVLWTGDRIHLQAFVEDGQAIRIGKRHPQATGYRAGSSGGRTGVQLDVPSDRGRGQVLVHLHGELDETDPVVVGRGTLPGDPGR